MRRIPVRIGFIHLLWALPVLFGLHNLEEFLGMELFSKTYLPGVYTITPAQFNTALILITLAGFLMSCMAIRNQGRGFWLYAPLWLQSILFVNAFTHIAVSVIFGAAAPGVFSAVLVNIPFTLWLFVMALREGFVGGRGLSITFIAGLISYVPVTLASLMAGLFVSKLLL